MRLERFSVKKIFLLVCCGMAAFMLGLCALFYIVIGQVWVLIFGILLIACAFIWLFFLTLFFSKRLPEFAGELCRAMDQMIIGTEEPVRATDRETLFARISYRLTRLYHIMQENRRKVDAEWQELQMLVSDISHQVKTPVSNLKMVTDTLEFLFQALVKTSRLETGAIRLEKKDALLIDTLAAACSGIVYAAEKKNIS